MPANGAKTPKRDVINFEINNDPEIREAAEEAAKIFNRSVAWIFRELVRAFLIDDRKAGLAALGRASLPAEVVNDIAPARAAR